MRARTPQFLLLAALAVVGYFLWDVVVTPALDASRREAAQDDLVRGALLEGDLADAEGGGPVLSGLGREANGEEAGALGGAAGAGSADGARAARGAAAEIHFQGRVVAANGRPAAGVRIVMRGPGGALEVVTDADGRFDRSARPGRYALLFDGGPEGGLVVREYMLDGAPRDDLEFELREPAALAVSVRRGEDGVAGATLVLASRVLGDLGRYEATTDLEGLASFEGLPPGPYDLTAQVPGGPLVTHRMQTRAASRTEVKVRIPDGVTLTGLVRAGPDGPGVAGATLTLQTRARTSDGIFETVFHSGPDGSFEVVVPRGRPHQLLVEATGFAPWPTERERGAVLKSLRQLDGKGPVTRNVALRNGAALSGLIHTENDEPIPGIVLRVKPRRGPIATATTGDDGRYAVAQLNPGPHTLQIETEAYFPIRGQVTWISIPGGAQPEPQVLDLVLVAARRLDGVVLDAAGQPVPGARVWIVGGGVEVRSARDAGRLLETFTDAAGRWTIADIPPDKNVVVRAALGLLEADPFSAPFRNPPSPPITLRLRGTGTLRGTVQDLVSRAAVPAARVRLVPTSSDGRTGRTAVADDQGAFVFEGVLPGDWLATPSKTGFLAAEPATVSVPRDGETRTVLGLDPGEVFAGTVVDEAGRSPRNARVTVRGTPDGGDKPIARGQAVTGAGTFRLTGFKRGLYTVTASCKGYRAARTGQLRGGDTRLQFVLRLIPLR